MIDSNLASLITFMLLSLQALASDQDVVIDPLTPKSFERKPDEVKRRKIQDEFEKLSDSYSKSKNDYTIKKEIADELRKRLQAANSPLERDLLEKKLSAADSDSFKALLLFSDIQDLYKPAKVAMDDILVAERLSEEIASQRKTLGELSNKRKLISEQLELAKDFFVEAEARLKVRRDRIKAIEDSYKNTVGKRGDDDKARGDSKSPFSGVDGRAMYKETLEKTKKSDEAVVNHNRLLKKKYDELQEQLISTTKEILELECTLSANRLKMIYINTSSVDPIKRDKILDMPLGSNLESQE